MSQWFTCRGFHCASHLFSPLSSDSSRWFIFSSSPSFWLPLSLSIIAANCSPFYHTLILFNPPAPSLIQLFSWFTRASNCLVRAFGDLLGFLLFFHLIFHLLLPLPSHQIKSFAWQRSMISLLSLSLYLFTLSFFFFLFPFLLSHSLLYSHFCCYCCRDKYTCPHQDAFWWFLVLMMCRGKERKRRKIL